MGKVPRAAMRKVLPLLPIFLVVAGWAVFPGAADASEEERLSATFDAYRVAVLNGRGSAAADLVTGETIAYYQSSRDDALTLSRAELETRPIIDQIQILSLRQYLDAAELQGMDGRGLFIWAVDEGLVGEEGVRRIELTDFSIRDNDATGLVSAGGKRSTFRFRFAREDGEWRLDLLSVMAPVSSVMEAQAKKFGGRKIFIEYLIAQGFGGQARTDIWEPLVR